MKTITAFVFSFVFLAAMSSAHAWDACAEGKTWSSERSRCETASSDVNEMNDYLNENYSARANPGNTLEESEGGNTVRGANTVAGIATTSSTAGPGGSTR